MAGIEQARGQEACEAVSQYHGDVTIGKPIMSSPDEPMYYEYSYAGTGLRATVWVERITSADAGL